MKELIEVLRQLCKEERDVIIENLDGGVKDELLESSLATDIDIGAGVGGLVGLSYVTLQGKRIRKKKIEELMKKKQQCRDQECRDKIDKKIKEIKS